MLHAVGDQAIGNGIPVHERTEALALIHDGGRCYGAVVRDLITGELIGLRRQGHRARHRRRRPAVSRHHQRRDLRRHRPRPRAGDRGRRARQHGGGAIPPHRHLSRGHPRHRGLPRRRRPAEGRRRPPLHARLRAGEEGARVARRRVAAHGRAHRARARARRAASAITCGSTSRCWARAHQDQPARGLRDLPLLPRRRSDQGLDPRAAGAALHDGRRAHRRTPARARPCRACSPPARRRAGTCTASTAWAATRWPRPWSRA